ncbi:MAG: glycosyltransferase family 2 protein [Fusobacterium sp.]
MKKLTILTPTYNRAYILPKLFESLLDQTNLDFEWMIIDDGSTDTTKNLVENFKNSKFKVRYYYKKNGGKHTAHNFGINKISTELTMVVDSDDILTKDAVESILIEWEKVRDKNLCGMSFLKADFNYKVSGKLFCKERYIGNFIEERINKNDLGGEKAEIWVTKVLKQYPFPVFENEKYVGEGSIWCLMAKKYDMLFINKIIYLYEYIPDGLTRSGRYLRISNPCGGMFAAEVAFSKEFNLIYKVKKMILYLVYSFFKKQKLKISYRKLSYKFLFWMCLPISYCIYIYWKKKYKIKR